MIGIDRLAEADAFQPEYRERRRRDGVPQRQPFGLKDQRSLVIDEDGRFDFGPEIAPITFVRPTAFANDALGSERPDFDEITVVEIAAADENFFTIIREVE